MPSVYSSLPTSGPLSFLDLRQMFGGPQQGSAGGLQSYTVPGCYTYVVPNSTNTVQLLLIGGGGAGAQGSCTYSSAGGSGGGGGGGFVNYSASAAVNPGATLTITVGAKGVATTGNQSGSGSASIVYQGGTTLLSAAGGNGGFKSGIGGASGGSIRAGGGRITNITSSTTSTQSHSAGGGGGAAAVGAFGYGGWPACCTGTAGAGGSGQSVTFQSRTFVGGGGGGGGAPFTNSGNRRGSPGAGNSGIGGFVSSAGAAGADGFGGGGGGGGAGGILISPTTQTNFLGWIDGPHLYVCVVNDLKLSVGARLSHVTTSYGGVVITGTRITSLVNGTGVVSGAAAIGGTENTVGYALGVTAINTATVYAHFIVCPPQYSYDRVPITIGGCSCFTSCYTKQIHIVGSYVGMDQAITRGVTITPGLGGAGGTGGVYLYAQDACAGPVPIGCYYRAGAFVPNAPANNNIPTSGAIVVPCDFYGSRGSYIYYYCLPNGQYDNNFNLLSRAMAACPPYPNTGGVPLEAFITINGVMGSNNADVPAFDTGSGWTRPPKICVSIGATGIVTGAGATLGSRNAACANGGDSMYLRNETNITNLGIIQGGGGAGYPAGTNSAGGAGYYAGSQGGSLFTGGVRAVYTYASGKKSKSSNTVYGGHGGGWVSGVSPSIDGWGGGGQGYNGCYGPQSRGGGPPGTAIINKSTYAIFNGSPGTVRGLCNNP